MKTLTAAVLTDDTFFLDSVSYFLTQRVISPPWPLLPGNVAPGTASCQ